MKILICGLSGSGKTTLATNLTKRLEYHNSSVEVFNADLIRTEYNDWDFSMKGRIRQSKRMKILSDNSMAEFIICDFIAPTQPIRNNINADFIIWMDTITECIYEDTNKIFEIPEKYDLRVRSHNFSTYVLNTLVNNIFYKLQGH